MKLDRPSEPNTPDPLSGEDLLRDLSPPSETVDACQRVRARIFEQPQATQTRGWATPLAAAAAILLAVGGLHLPDLTRPVAAPTPSAVDVDGGFEELRQMGTRLAVLEEDCDRLEQDDFWGVRPGRKRMQTR